MCCVWHICVWCGGVHVWVVCACVGGMCLRCMCVWPVWGGVCVVCGEYACVLCVGGCIVCGGGVTQTTRSSWVKQMALAYNASTLPLTHFVLCVHRWSHEYQEATIEKIIRFLQGRPSQDSSAGSDTSLEGATPMGLP